MLVLLLYFYILLLLAFLLLQSFFDAVLQVLQIFLSRRNLLLEPLLVRYAVVQFFLYTLKKRIITVSVSNNDYTQCTSAHTCSEVS